MFALPHINQAAHYVAHHVMQECVGAQFKCNDVAVTGDIDLRQIAHGGPGLAFGGAKCAEVVLAQKKLRARPHGFNIEWLMKPTHSVPVKTGAYTTVQ